MKRHYVLLLALVAVLLFTSPAWRTQQGPRDIQAVVVKVINDVNKKAPTAGWTKAIPLERLKSGYQISTGEGSLALIRFADETKLVLRSKSVVEIRGKVEGKEITDRNVHLDRGNVQFDVRKQQREQFQFSSPTSVASIRGTKGEFETIVTGVGGKKGGALQSDEERSDRLTIIEGLASLLNLLTQQAIEVRSQQTGQSNSRGGLNVRPSTPGELNSASLPPTQGSLSPSGPTGSTGSGTTSTVVSNITIPTPSKIEKPLKITVDLVEGVSVSKAVLRYRVQNENSFKELPLLISGRSGSATIPGEELKGSYVDYYLSFVVSDKDVTHPLTDPENNPFRIPLVASKLVSTVTVPSSSNTKTQLVVSVDFEQDANVQRAIFRYRLQTDGSFKESPMFVSGRSAKVTIPAEEVKSTYMDYYFVFVADGKETFYPNADAETNPLRILLNQQKVQLRIEGEDKDGNRKNVIFEWYE
jgi:hypothetical protein